jgi:septum formation protein
MASDEQRPKIPPQTNVNAVVNKPIVLASASPRRQQLLAYIVEQFTIEVADVDETPKKNESAYDLVERLAKMKAQFISDKFSLDPSAPDVMVIGSDTVVAKADGILGKPIDYNDFAHMMKTLSDDSHQVYTGVCVVCGDVVVHDVVITQVLMSEITEQDMADYWTTNEPQDKAGGYAIQGIGGKFVKEIKGSFSAVVGLPLFETKHLIAQMQEKLKN